MTGLGDQAGSLAEGQPANLVAVDAAGKLVASIREWAADPLIRCLAADSLTC
jgi:cytosine/adenosine deaminase-related metal-dependent hydrolase